MKRILLSSTLVVFALAAVYVGATGAFFSDSETSTGNTFSAGAIDLKVDNESYYNGVLNAGTTWELVDLTIQKFFDFIDLKPGDYGEDTISLHVFTNDAYLCANVTLTSDDDNEPTEPETAVDTDTGVGQGELADAVNFIWWADDGDNVLETDEEVISSGPLGALAVGQTATVALADSATNIWETTPGPAPGDETLYIGKAWCFGAIAGSPLVPGSYSGPDNPANAPSPSSTGQATPEDGGYTCSGAGLGNETQTDSVTADVSFSATQSRNNPGFLCAPGENCVINTDVTLVPNSGFETPEVTNGAQWDIFPSPAGTWNVLWRSDIPATFGAQNRPEIANLEFHEGVLGAASEGDQYVELDTDWGGPSDPGNGEPASVTIYQNLATVAGKQYEVHYKFAPRPSTPDSENNVEARAGGIVGDTTGPTAGGGGPIAWTERSFTFTATTTSTQISFTDLGTANSLGSFLDDVRVYGQICTPIVAVDAQ
ncbi:hypothetical protein H7X87_02270 [Acetobacteraceae bacterium]|nr:hypothetical protein [Candidatus Parcubacteria bacterium]